MVAVVSSSLSLPVVEEVVVVAGVVAAAVVVAMMSMLLIWMLRCGSVEGQEFPHDERL